MERRHRGWLATGVRRGFWLSRVARLARRRRPTAHPWTGLTFYGLGVVLEVLLLALILRSAWTWPRTPAVPAGRAAAAANLLSELADEFEG
jgi:hypothetical protein